MSAVSLAAPRGFWRRRRTDIITPLVLLDSAMITSVKYGRGTLDLKLPTAEFSVWAPVWMLIPIFVSFFIRSHRWAIGIWWAAMAGMFYAPLLLFAGSTSIRMPRALSKAETAEFEKRFSAPALYPPAENGRHYVRVRRGDVYDALRAYAETLAAPLEKK